MPSLRSINTESDSFCDVLSMTVGFRLPLHVTPEDTCAALRQFAESDGEIVAYGMEYAYKSDRNNSLVRGMLAALRANGLQPGFMLKTGTSDMNVVGRMWHCPIIAYGPGDSKLDHTPDERLPLSEYEQAVAVLRRLIETLPGS
jgi:LysW-gamma-L-lysine carboxypeptidase